jgi:DNA-binding CsgD family transcriptional regulator
MYLKWTSDFIRFLGDQDHNIEEVLAHLVLRAMAPLQATSAFISILDNQNSIITVGRFGIPEETTSSYEERFQLSDRLPITDALRLRKIVVVNTLPKWPSEYPLLVDTPYPTMEASLISFPIERCGTPMAVATVFFNFKVLLNDETIEFIDSIANLLSLYLFSPAYRHESRKDFTPEDVIGIQSQRGLPLSQRQDLILRMISEGRTNLAIGEILQYSESTIRQETIKIFSKLGCDGRLEAADIYRVKELAALESVREAIA